MQTYKDEYLVHFGVPGMKWGHRKVRISSGGGFRGSSRNNKSPQQVKAARKSKLKTAAKVGAGLAAGALAAYGTSKLIKNKSMKIQIEKGQEAFDRIMYRNINNVGRYHPNNQKGLDKITKIASDKADRAMKLNVQKGASMNTREAAKNVVNYYRKKKR